MPNNYQKDIKDEKKDAVKYRVEATKDPKNKEPLTRLSKEETGHMETLKAIVKKSK